MVKAEKASFQESVRTDQRLVMQNRQKVELNGVTEVVSFDNNEIVLETTQGGMRFAGENLHVKRLTLEQGEVSLEGKIREISYHESRKDSSAGSVLRRLFR